MTDGIQTLDLPTCDIPKRYKHYATQASGMDVCNRISFPTPTPREMIKTNEKQKNAKHINNKHKTDIKREKYHEGKKKTNRMRRKIADI